MEHADILVGLAVIAALQVLTLWRCWYAGLPTVVLIEEDDYDDVPTAEAYDGDSDDDMQAADWWKHGKEPPV